MRILCFFCSIISFCSSLAAVGFIWVRVLLPVTTLEFFLFTRPLLLARLLPCCWVLNAVLHSRVDTHGRLAQLMRPLPAPQVQ